MPLFGKNLTAGASGLDVVVLHDALRALGYDLASDEVSDQVFGRSTVSAVRQFQATHNLSTTGVLDDPTLESVVRQLGRPLSDMGVSRGVSPGSTAPNPWLQVIRGQVMYSRGLPVARLPIQVVHRTLRQAIPLGSTTTNERGEYTVTYSTADLPGHTADIQVRAFADKASAKRGRAEDAVAQSRIIYAAGPLEKIRLRVYGGPQTQWSEYQQLQAELATHLADVAPATLDERPGQHDLSLLAGKTNQPMKRIADYVIAEKLATSTEIPASMLYGLIRSDMGTDLGTLLAQDDAQLKRTIRRAGDAGLIPGELPIPIDAVAPKLRQAAVAHLAADPDELGGALTALPDGDKRTTFLTQLIAATGPSRDGGAAEAAQRFWAGLQTDHRFAEHVPQLQLGLQLGAITGGHAPLAILLAKQAQDRAINPSRPLRALAAMTAADLEDLINRLPEDQRVPDWFGMPYDPAADFAIPASQRAVRAYAHTLSRIVADAMPTAVLANQFIADDGQPEAMRTFFKNVLADDSEFDLRMPLPTGDQWERLLEGVADKTLVTTEVAALKRMFNITTNYEHMNVLRAAGLDSARAIDQLGAGVFLSRYADQLGGQTQALKYAEIATRISATSAALYTSTSRMFDKIPVYVLSVFDSSGHANLETLFGPVDACTGADRQNVLSPSAYFTELLAWLAARELPGGRTARDILLARRPDLGEIELSCPNTDTGLPLIDLVNELLELTVTPPPTATLSDEFAAELDDGEIPTGLLSALAAAGIPLSPDHRALVVTAGSHWFLTDRSTLWVIRRTAADQLTATFGSYQTGGGTTDLQAEPEHQSSGAYDQLRTARYPINLPLDLWTAQVRTYLGHLSDPGSTAPNRAELMRILTPVTVDVETSEAIARESLGLTVAEQDRITTTDPEDPWLDYGLAEQANPTRIFDPLGPDHYSVKDLSWDHALRWVPVLVDRVTGSYDDLLEALATDFVNPEGKARVESADPSDLASCEMAKLILTGADLNLLSRLRRFTRLRSKLGWTARQLDDLVTALAGGIADVNDRLNSQVLIGLAGACRLQSRLGLDLAELPGFWAALAANRPDDAYFRLFGDPAVLRPPDPAFAIDQTSHELAIVTTDPAGADIEKHTPTILATLGLDATELAELISLLPDKTLNRQNLSRLYRYTRLSRALDLTVNELVALTELTDDIFPQGPSGPAATNRFATLVGQVRATGLTITEIDYLLFNQTKQTIAGQSVAVPDTDIAIALCELRNDLRAVVDQTTVVPDPEGAALDRALAALRWPASFLSAVITVLAGASVHSAPLATWPAGLTPPDALATRISYAGKTLNITGALTTAERDSLLAATPDPSFAGAVMAIYEQPRAILATMLKVFRWPVFQAKLAALPAGLEIPAAFRGRLYFDAATGYLIAKSPISSAEGLTLAAVSNDPGWLAAVTGLVAAPEALNPSPEEAFLTAAEAATLLDLPPDGRFAAVLPPVLAFLRRSAGRQLVVQRLAATFGIPVKVADRLLCTELPAASDAQQPVISDLLADPFITSDLNVPVTRATFAAQFDSYLQVHKVTQLIAALKLTTVELDWLAAYRASVPARPIPWRANHVAGWWDPRSIPVTAITRSAEPLAALLRVVELDRLRDRHTEPATTELLAAARVPESPDQLAARFADTISTAGNPIGAAEILRLAAELKLHLPEDLKDEVGPNRLRDAVTVLRRTGASATQLIGMLADEPTQADARAARQLVRAKYDDAGWTALAKPLRDMQRAQQRDALVGFILGNPGRFLPRTVRDSADLYGHLLIDTEMEPIVATTRIAQAIAAVQLFVQRCFLSLEPEVTVDAAADPGWRDWDWMYPQPFWGAHREITCFPENWIVPSLRDDKTPFFAELESKLMQDDVTAEVAEDAFAGYLSQLADVARLEILGLWDQPAVDGQPATLHVFGRSRGAAPTYYHRTRVAGGAWTAWQRLDLEISEPQILPVVWNRRLFLFWPLFTEVTPDPVPGDKPTMPTNRYFTITLAYSHFDRGKWKPKQLTDLTITTELAPTEAADHGKGRFVLRATVPGAGGPDLWIWPEWDNPTSKTITWATPYHPGTPGTKKSAVVNGFHFTGADEAVEEFRQNISGICEPSGTIQVGMLFVQDGGQPLQLPSDLYTTAQGRAFTTSPPTFSLAYPHQDSYLTGQRTFVYQDGAKSYVVDPFVDTQNWEWLDPAKVSPGIYAQIKDRYYAPAISAAAAALAHRSGWPIGPRPVEVAALGTSDPVRRALAVTDAQRAFLADAAAVEKDLALRPAGLDKRLVLSKADKKAMGISSYIDAKRIDAGAWNVLANRVRRYRFRTGFHPYVTQFQQDLACGGIDRLVSLTNQQRSSDPFAGRYGPKELVSKPYPVEDVDFEPDGTYQQYNWELFFHAPLLIATRLSANQRFADARAWFHLIFDPTDKSNGPTPARFWRTRPLNEQTQPKMLAQRITDILTALAGGTADPGLLQQIAGWRADPFNPYAIARLRLAAFQKMVVMAYLDNLIAWADQLFRQDTRESINQAAQLYVLAAEILGKRPTDVKPRATPQVRTAISLDAELDAFSDKLVGIEQVLGAYDPDAVVTAPGAPPLSWPKMLYFGVPRNERLARYWDTVADRLFKIHNSMNIEGVVRQLPFFSPRLDPALLVRAAAAGIDLSSALADITAPAPHYRFRTLVTQALSLTADVRALGAELMAALEKKDAEQLSVLRATHEKILGDQIERVHLKRQEEADQRIASLDVQRDGAVARYQHFRKLLGLAAEVPKVDQPIPLLNPSTNATIDTSEGVKLLNFEKKELSFLDSASSDQLIAASTQSFGNLMAILPTFNFAAKPWGIGTGWSWGGGNLAAAANALASVFTARSVGSTFVATKAARLAQAVIREHDWVLQCNTAAAEIMSIDSQRLAAEIASQTAAEELKQARLARDQSASVLEYLSTKYTDQELYTWMVSQVSALYFQSYQLAYDMAKKAERAMRRELGLQDSDHIQFGYWDSLRKGLLAGERLQLAIQRMSTAYLDANRRTYELTKHISFAAVNPAALVELRETGRCEIRLPEALFDLDRPGDYQRRIKMVSLTLPCVAGAYASVNCRLTLLSSSIRVKPTPSIPYKAQLDDHRFVTSTGPMTSIVTSTGHDDSGMFAPDFAEERFLPAEGEGVISTWRLELPGEFRQFDYQTISDVVLTLRYTALDGGEPLRAAATAALKSELQAMEVDQGRRGLYRLLSARQDYPSAFRTLEHPPPASTVAPTLTVTLGPDKFPFLYQRRALKIDKLAVFLRVADYAATEPFTVTLKAPGLPGQSLPVSKRVTDLGGLPAAVTEFPNDVTVGENATWTLELSELPSALVEKVDVDGTQVDRLRAGALDDIGILLHYTF